MYECLPAYVCARHVPCVHASTHVGECVCVCVYYVSDLCLLESEGGIGFPEIVVTNGCEPLCGSWEQNPGSL